MMYCARRCLPLHVSTRIHSLCLGICIKLCQMHECLQFNANNLDAIKLVRYNYKKNASFVENSGRRAMIRNYQNTFVATITTAKTFASLFDRSFGGWCIKTSHWPINRIGLILELFIRDCMRCVVLIVSFNSKSSVSCYLLYLCLVKCKTKSNQIVSNQFGSLFWIWPWLASTYYTY